MSQQILKPESNAQLKQMFRTPEFKNMKKRFIRTVLTNLKFYKNPKYGHQLKNIIEKDLDKGLNDDEIYEHLNEVYFSKLIKFVDKSDFSRAKNRVEQLKMLYEKGLLEKGVNSYLDVGCNEGSITRAFGEFLEAKNILGCDVFKAKEEYDFDFTLLKNPCKLPYRSKSQDVVSAFMSLHHIECLDEMLKEISRVLKKDGVFVIREHDRNPPEMSLLFDLLHAFYAMVWSSPPEIESFKDHYSNYTTKEELKKIIESNGFECKFLGEPAGTWRYYYALFVKK